jgi:hypothetical protein
LCRVCATKGSVEIAKLLIEKGALVDAQETVIYTCYLTIRILDMMA